jgi:hypothetical protein
MDDARLLSEGGGGEKDKYENERRGFHGPLDVMPSPWLAARIQDKTAALRGLMETESITASEVAVLNAIRRQRFPMSRSSAV